MTINLGLDQVAGNQTNKFITINDATGGIDAAMTNGLAVAITSSNARTLTALEFTGSFFFNVDEDGADPATAAITLTVPSTARGTFQIVNLTAFDITPTIASQPITAPIVAAGETKLMSSDGVNVKEIGGGAGGSTTFIGLTDVPSTFAGQAEKALQVNAGETAVEFVSLKIDVGDRFVGAPGNSAIIFQHLVTRPYDLSASLPLSVGKSGTSATAQTDFSIQKNGSEFGIMRFAAAGTIASFIAANTISFVNGDEISIVGPSSADATIADLVFSLAGQKGITDPDFSSVSLLLGFEGAADNATVFADESSTGTGVTFTNAGVAVDAAQAKFGIRSIDIVSNAYLAIPHATNVSMANANDMTFEAHVRSTDVTQINGIFNKRDGASAEEFYMIINNGLFQVNSFISGSADITLSGGTAVNNTWYHVAFTREGTTWRLFVDGALIATQVQAGQPTANSAVLHIGNSAFNSGRWFRGNIDEIRITAGLARYTAAFTAPTLPYPRS